MFVSSEPLIFLLHCFFVLLWYHLNPKEMSRFGVPFPLAFWSRGAGTKNSSFTRPQRVEECETSRDTGGNIVHRLEQVRDTESAGTAGGRW